MTILFLDEWSQYPSAIVDTATVNTSFIRYSALLREMNIKNHAFPLQLHNPLLQGVNPFDANLTPEQILMIAIESKNNVFYFMREVVRVPAPAGPGVTHLFANRGNIALFWLFYNHIMTMLIQPRQTGKSVSTDALQVYLLNVRCQNTTINLLTKDDALRARNLARIKDIAMELPWYMQRRSKKDVANTEEITIAALKNSYKGFLPHQSPKQALNVGRGLTSPIFHIDELAFLYNNEIMIPAALAGGGAARDIAASRGEPYGTIMTTTAGKKDDRDGKYAYQRVVNSAIWSEHFYDVADAAALEHVIRRASPKGTLAVNCTFSHRQLGYTDEWLKRKMEESGAVGDDADRDFFNRWTSGTQRLPLPIHLMERIRESRQIDCHTQISKPYGYVTRWYIPEAQLKPLMLQQSTVMGLDTSDAVGRDDIGMVIRHVVTGEIVAAGNYNETNLITFAKWIAELLEQYPKMTLIIERRSSGASILDYLILQLVSKGIDPFKRLYNRVVQDAEEQKERFKELQRPFHMRHQEVYTQYRKHFGFATSGSGLTSRTELYSTILLAAAKNTGDRVRDTILVDQILGLTTRNGRIDHGEDDHDDVCIAWLLTYWLLSNGKHLDFYGIDSRVILREINSSDPEVAPENLYQKQLQRQLRTRIEQLIAVIQNEHDPYISMKYERELMALSQDIVLEEGETFSVDNLLKELREQKQLQNSNHKTSVMGYRPQGASQGYYHRSPTRGSIYFG